jgi:hypothetical protein
VTPTNRCLDGETMAAWVDGGLTRNDAAMAEAHVSTCPRCQEIAGLIVKTTPVTVVDAPWWRRRAAWLVPVSVSVAAVGLLMIAPTSPLLSPAAPPATAPLDSAQKSATPAEPPVAPPAEPRAAETRPAQANQERRRDERANTAADAAAAPAAAPPPAAALGRRAEEQLAQNSLGAAAARRAISPDGALHWRITDRGTLERSIDAGTTWQAVNVGVTATFTTVQAPEPRAAIVTTPDGRQFRTTDAGTTWQLVAPKL